MKTLSDHLTDLSDRSKHIEDVVAAARDKNLQLPAGRRTALHTAMAHGGERLDDAGDDVEGDDVEGKLEAPWKHARVAVERSFATVREDADERRAHKNLARAERQADHAEQDAGEGAGTAAAATATSG